MGLLLIKDGLTVDDLADEKIIQIDQLPKSQPGFERFLTILGRNSIVVLEGDRWKRLRKMFNPAFAQGQLDALIPAIVEECEIFVQKLTGYADSGEVIKMMQLTTVPDLLVSGTDRRA